MIIHVIHSPITKELETTLRSISIVPPLLSRYSRWDLGHSDHARRTYENGRSPSPCMTSKWWKPLTLTLLWLPFRLESMMLSKFSLIKVVRHRLCTSTSSRNLISQSRPCSLQKCPSSASMEPPSGRSAASSFPLSSVQKCYASNSSLSTLRAHTMPSLAEPGSMACKPLLSPITRLSTLSVQMEVKNTCAAIKSQPKSVTSLPFTIQQKQSKSNGSKYPTWPY